MILAISIIGIPLLLLVIPFAMLALTIGILLGFVAVAKYIGHEAERAVRVGPHQPVPVDSGRASVFSPC